MSQKFESSYNIVIDYDGKNRYVKHNTGKWFCTDSTLYQTYVNDTLEYKIYKIVNRDVYYTNDFDEIIKVFFMANGSVLKINTSRPQEYLIYRKE
jgi:hypothetical protein